MKRENLPMDLEKIRPRIEKGITPSDRKAEQVHREQGSREELIYNVNKNLSGVQR